MSQATETELPMLERRRIEAQVLKHVYETLKSSHGVEVAQQTVGDAVKASSIEQAQGMAAAVNGNTSMQTFVDRQSQWTASGALEIEVLEQSDDVYRFDVKRCRYSEMYREMGLGDIGHLLSCKLARQRQWIDVSTGWIGPTAMPQLRPCQTAHLLTIQ